MKNMSFEDYEELQDALEELVKLGYVERFEEDNIPEPCYGITKKGLEFLWNQDHKN
jgi:predicted transcriptional regulator